MKKILCMMLLLSVFVLSCSKDETKPNNNTNTNNANDNYYFTTKIDGVEWSADMSSKSSYVNTPHPGMLTISAALTQVTSGFFLINLYNYTGAKTYIVGGAGNNSYARYTTGSVGAGTYSAWKAEDPGSTTTGTVTITSDANGVVEGTVVFDGYSEEKKTTKKITEGKFRMKKQ